MKQIIIIGKKGQQPFPITSSAVQERHAQITINDNEEWFLEDLSQNRTTFIQKEDGSYRRIERILINKDTIICLGASDSRGCTFMAHHITVKDPDDYIYEFNKLRERKSKIEAKQASLDKIKSYLNVCMSLAFFGLCLVPWDTYISIRFAGFIFTLYNLYIQWKQKEIRKLTANFLICPKCKKPLQWYEIKEGKCYNPNCGAHS